MTNLKSPKRFFSSLSYFCHKINKSDRFLGLSRAKDRWSVVNDNLPATSFDKYLLSSCRRTRLVVAIIGLPVTYTSLFAVYRLFDAFCIKFSLSVSWREILAIKISRNRSRNSGIIYILVRLYCEVSDVAMWTLCVRDAHTIDAERIDVTVDSIKWYYSNILRNATYAMYCEWETSSAKHKLRPHARLLMYSSLLSHTRTAIHSALARVRPRGLFREITESQGTSLARKCAGQRLRSNPALPRGWISAFETSTPRLHFSRAVHRERAIISVLHENRRSRRKWWHFNEVHSISRIVVTTSTAVLH